MSPRKAPKKLVLGRVGHRVPEHYKPLIQTLRRAGDSDGPTGALARALVDFVVDVVTTSDDGFADQAPTIGHRIDVIASALSALEESVSNRLDGIELAIAELNRRTQPAQETEVPTTVFGIYVELADGVDNDRVRKEIALLPRGLDAESTVQELEKLGLLHRTPDKQRSPRG